MKIKLNCALCKKEYEATISKSNGVADYECYGVCDECRGVKEEGKDENERL